jgi:hypothetical protein
LPGRDPLLAIEEERLFENDAPDRIVLARVGRDPTVRSIRRRFSVNVGAPFLFLNASQARLDGEREKWATKPSPTIAFSG